MTSSAQGTRDITVRPLAEVDVPAAARLLPRTNDLVPVEALAADLAENRARWPSLQLGAYERGRLLGLVAGRLDAKDPRLGWSDDIVLSEEARGLGLGGRLIRGQLGAFRALGCARVRGLSPRRLFGAVPFFEKHGFRVVEETVARGVWGIADGEPLWITECRLEP